jgi:hypothetical protein
VQSFGSWLSAGVSVEAPATIFGGSVATAPLGTGGAFTSGSTIVNGTVVNFNNPGGQFLTGATIATDQNPDIIEKLALDPGWGHYEVFGVQRWFTDNTLNCITGLCIAGSTTMTGYKGQYGRVAAGAQYEYIKRKSFDGLGGAPSTYDHVAFTSLRYYPF